MKNNKKIWIGILSIVGIISITLGVTMAFFNYTRTGASNIISVGRISFVSRQSQTINLTNVFPINKSDINTDTDNVDIVEIEIEGDTDYNDGVEYLVSSENTNISTSTGKIVPISLDVSVTNLGTENANYFEARNNKNTTIYKKLVGGELVGDQMLLVGYIKPNTTAGTIEGVNGKLTIKAFFDEDKIAVSDTYNGTESGNYGTTNEWVNGRTVLTTSEWNSLSVSGISFKIKVEANEGIWVKQPIDDIVRVKNISTTTQQPTLDTGINFTEVSSSSNGQGVYMMAGTQNDSYPIVYYRGDVSDNNVYFAGKCWQIVRTTETGGTKMIYNGVNTGTASAPACGNTTVEARQITLNSTNIFTFSGTDLYNSPAYGGFMYASPVYSIIDSPYESGSKFGNSVVWNGTSYTLVDVSNAINTTHRYTCGTADTVTCSSVRYYPWHYTTSGTDKRFYFNLTNGKTIEDVVSESLSNGAVDSNAKEKIETWYAANIDSASRTKIEDAIYCNDRSIYQLGGMDPSVGASLTAHMFFSPYGRNHVNSSPSVSCSRRQDSFTSTSERGNGLLDYPVGLITIDEVALAGGKTGTANADFYLNSGADYWTISPRVFYNDAQFRMFYVTSAGAINSTNPGTERGLRPVISLKIGTQITGGTGTALDPYVIG